MDTQKISLKGTKTKNNCTFNEFGHKKINEIRPSTFYCCRKSAKKSPFNIDKCNRIFFFYFNWGSRLHSHYEAWSYKKKNTQKRLEATENLFRKNLQLKDVC